MQVPLSDVQVLQDAADAETVAGEKDETFAHMKEWKRQYMRGISHTPSQAGVYYEALKGSSHSLAKGYITFFIHVKCMTPKCLTFNLNLQLARGLSYRGASSSSVCVCI